MASENKKRKAKNSYIVDGGEKADAKMKRFYYYTKRNRKKVKNVEKDVEKYIP